MKYVRTDYSGIGQLVRSLGRGGTMIPCYRPVVNDQQYLKDVILQVPWGHHSVGESFGHNAGWFLVELNGLKSTRGGATTFYLPLKAIRDVTYGGMAVVTGYDGNGIEPEIWFQDEADAVSISLMMGPHLLG